MRIERTLKKAARDLGVFLLASGAWWLANHVGELGLPTEIAPVVATVAMMIYRAVRDKTTTPSGD